MRCSTPRRRRALCALSACGLGALALGALAGPAGAASGSTSTSTPLLTSATVSIALKMALPGRAVSTLVAAGQIDFAHQAMALSVTLPETGPRPHGLAKGRAHLSGALTFKGEWVGGSAYVTLPASAAALAGGAPDVSIPTTAALRTEITTALTQTLVAVTYAKTLLDTLAPSQTQTRVGIRTIDGVKAEGTEVDLSFSQLLKVVPALSPGMGPSVGTMGHTEIPVTLWVDRQGRLVETVLAQPKSATTWIAGTVHFTHLDAPVSITAPAPDSARPISKGELAFLAAEDPFGLQS